MNTESQITAYLKSQPESTAGEMQKLHDIILEMMPGAILWFLDGKNDEGKVVSNPSIGYGSYTIYYANGKTRDFYQIGMSANTTGISVYIMGLDDKKYLADNFGKRIGKAKVTGYCIHFKSLEVIDLEVLKEAIHAGIKFHQNVANGELK